MLLTRSGILEAISTGHVAIEPFDESQLNPNSYDLRLGKHVVRYTPGVIDAAKPHEIIQETIPAEGIVLQPGELYLMATKEVTKTSNYVPGIEGRSSVGRLGVSVHATAGFGDVGFHGTWTLEVYVIRPVRIYEGMRICQIFFEDCSTIRKGDVYCGKYNGQIEPRESRVYMEASEWVTESEVKSGI